MDSLEQIKRKIDFIREIDKLKSIMRRSFILDGARNENDAEHSWHVSLMSVIFLENALEPNLDLLRVVKMLLVHDLVEIDAGDTYAFDEAAHEDKAERETRAADRIFRILPEKEAEELRALWDEFEAAETPEAKYALALDRVQPMLLNYFAQGKAWKQHRITPDRVAKRIEILDETIPDLGKYARELIAQAADKGYFS